jgi:hypothetical protein
MLSRLRRAIALAFGDRDFYLGFCLAFDHLFEFLFRFFLFLFCLNWLLVCVVNALIKRGIEDRASEDRWMVAPGCDE